MLRRRFSSKNVDILYDFSKFLYCCLYVRAVVVDGFFQVQLEDEFPSSVLFAYHQIWSLTLMGDAVSSSLSNKNRWRKNGWSSCIVDASWQEE